MGSHDYIEKAHGSHHRNRPSHRALLKDLKRTACSTKPRRLRLANSATNPDNGVAAWGRDHNANARPSGSPARAPRVHQRHRQNRGSAVKPSTPATHVALLHLLGLDDNRLRYFTPAAKTTAKRAAKRRWRLYLRSACLAPKLARLTPEKPSSAPASSPPVHPARPTRNLLPSRILQRTARAKARPTSSSPGTKHNPCRPPRRRPGGHLHTHRSLHR
jgi:hypothetical protein